MRQFSKCENHFSTKCKSSLSRIIELKLTAVLAGVQVVIVLVYAAAVMITCLRTTQSHRRTQTAPQVDAATPERN